MASLDAWGESRERIIGRIVAKLYERHPEWETRWSAGGRESCQRDVGFTLAFTEASVRGDDPSILAGYARWLAGLLRARGVPVESARESFALLADALADVLPATEGTTAASHLSAAAVAMDEAPAAWSGAAALSPLAERFLTGLLAGDSVTPQDILQEAVGGGMTSAQIADAIIQPAMTEIGARWARNELSVAQEHRATALAQRVLARYTAATDARAKGNAVVACVEGNLHSLGALVIADAWKAEGWYVDFLGADVPTRDLVDLVRASKVDLIGLSVALPVHLATAQRMVAALRRQLGEECPRIVVGGRPIADHARAAEAIGADALFTNASSGVTDAR